MTTLIIGDEIQLEIQVYESVLDDIKKIYYYYYIYHRPCQPGADHGV
jgi:hypothetical protein